MSGLNASVTEAAFAIGRLDQALHGHPLLPAALHRMRLDAVRRQAAVDGYAIDPWHLAAVIEHLPLRLGDVDRGGVFEAARYAFTQYQWLAAPDLEQEDAVQEAMAVLTRKRRDDSPLLCVARGLHDWLEAGHARSAMRTAIVRYLGAMLTRLPLPLTGAAALQADVPWDFTAWAPLFLQALAGEARDALRQLGLLEHGWLQARQAVAPGRRRNSRALAAIDLIAAAPLMSAVTLAGRLRMAPKNALILLDQFVEQDIVVEVTHRSARRLFGLKGLAPLAMEVALPRRARRGANRACESIIESEPLLSTVSPLARWQPDYADLEAAMAAADQAVRNADIRLKALGLDGPVAMQVRSKKER